MAGWDCNAGKIAIGETITHGINDDYGITVLLQDVSPYGSNKAVIDVYFYWNQNPDQMVILAPGEFESYTDPKSVEWRVHVDSTTYNGSSSTANVQICYEAAEPAEGQIMSIDVPAEAGEGDTLVIHTTFKNIGGVAARLFLRYYDGATLVRETAPGNVAAGQTIEDFAETFTMPGYAWTGRIDLMRET